MVYIVKVYRMNIAMVDDRETDPARLEQILKAYDSIHQSGLVFSHFSSGEALLQAYRPFRFTIVFLDFLKIINSVLYTSMGKRS